MADAALIVGRAPWGEAIVFQDIDSIAAGHDFEAANSRWYFPRT